MPLAGPVATVPLGRPDRDPGPAGPGQLPPGPPSGRRDERQSRARVGALLNAYYRVEGEQPQQASTGDGALDDHEFDATRYFEGMVASGHMQDLKKRKQELDLEIKDLNGAMELKVYENYTKFTRAAGVIKQMKFCLEGMEPDLRLLEAAIARVGLCQQRVEDGVGVRSTQIEELLRRQQLCHKIKVLFALPATLKRCLDGGEYGRAVEAYCGCSDFLRQYKHQPTFRNVLEDVEHQMAQIASALESRLRSPSLSVEEAVHSSVALLDMGRDKGKVLREFLIGREGMLRATLERCFAPPPAAAANGAEQVPLEELTRDQRELQQPESVLLHTATSRVNVYFVPYLCDAVEGFQKLKEGRSEAGPVPSVEDMLPEFVHARVEELCERLFGLIEQRRPPTRVLVSCVHAVRDALRRLHTSMPNPLTKLFMAFLSRTANCALRGIFQAAAASLVLGLRALHGECRRLQEAANAGLDDVLEQIARTEQTVFMSVFAALTDAQPLLMLVGCDRAALQHLVRDLYEDLVATCLAFVEACHRYIGDEPAAARSSDPSLQAVPPVAQAELEELSGLDWSGLFALALVRIGRHLEVKVINKVWSVARNLFVEGLGPLPTPPCPAPTARATRLVAQSVITYYVRVNGHRLAHFFRNFIQNKNWMTVKEPKQASPVVEKMILKDVHAFDAQLARILGDPRKPRAVERRSMSRYRSSMELEVARLCAKKTQVFVPIAFNRNGAVVGILRIAFKGLYEYMREEMFANFGVQQIQVDCAFLSEVVRDFVEPEDAAALDSLLEEAVTSAYQRCEGAALMDMAAVEALVAERKRVVTAQL